MRCVLILPLVLLFSAGPCQPSRSAADRPASPAHRTVESVATTLRAAGFNVKTADTISQPFFAVPGRVLIVDGNDLQVYEYPTSDAAAADAAKIDPSGSPIGTFMPSWMVPPHIYRQENLILVYLGALPRARASLEALAGPQIAGGK